MRNSGNWFNLMFSIGSLFIAGVLIWLTEPSTMGPDDKFTEYMLLIFSFLGAAVFAVVAIIADPGLLIPGTWRKALSDAREVQKKVHTLHLLVVVYLLVLGLGAFSETIPGGKISQDAARWYHLFFQWLSVVALILSLRLPYFVRDVQVERLDHEIEKRRRESQVNATEPTPSPVSE